MSTVEYSQAITTHRRSSWKNVYNCKFCQYFTTSLLSMTSHRLKQHYSVLEEFTCENAKIELYYCKDCDFKTKLTVLFKQHIHKYHSFKRESADSLLNEDFRIQYYVCEKCNFETNLSLKWIQHTSKCTGKKENLQIVPSPKENVTHNSDFKQTSEIRWYYCAKCSYKDNFKHYFNRHIRSHDSEKLYACDKCPYKSKYKSNLKMHISTLHQNDENLKWYKCNECPLKTKYRPNLKRHVIEQHLANENIKLYECEVCPFKTKRKNHLSQHEKVHSGIKSYQCDYCSYAGKRMEHLKRHINKHHLNKTESK
ncbi:hypothetical protein Zmor_020656 [Zophobas morio]|uniref:Protein hunchback n=1 Tax=Zophobas morio TaxID=2755281 RepID=A0AA38I4C3_9CUCU|nr:hypothetical protein Zmor_020656 [Zophobas morio]